MAKQYRTPVHTRGRLASLLGAGLAALCLVTGCDDVSGESAGESDSEGEAPALRDVHLLGELGDGAFISIVADEDDVVIYACDGEDDNVTMNEWFKGPHDDGAFELTSKDGAHVSGQFDAETATGSLTMPGGAAIEFDALVEDGDAGLYVLDDVDFLGGWVVRDDGTRGAVINRTTGDLVTGVSFSLGASTAIVQEQTFTIALLSEPVINL